MAMASLALSTRATAASLTGAPSIPRPQQKRVRALASRLSISTTTNASARIPLTARLASASHFGAPLLHSHSSLRRAPAEVPNGRKRGAIRAAANEGMKSLAVAVAIPLVLGVVDAIVNGPGTKWYFDLKKPRWQPPSFLFGGAWSVLYPLMGLASWLVWAEGGWAKQSYPLALYAVQVVLNLAWPALFFGARNLGAALVDIILLDVAVVATIAAFKPVNEVAANLLKPYLAWVLFATALNYKLWELNRGASSASASPAPST